MCSSLRPLSAPLPFSRSLVVISSHCPDLLSAPWSPCPQRLQLPFLTRLALRRRSLHSINVLESLDQWEVVSGAVVAPAPLDKDNPASDEIAAMRAFAKRRVSAFMEISFRVANSVRPVIDEEERDPVAAWRILERRFGAQREGLCDLLLSRLNQYRWDGKGPIYAHRDAMIALRAKLADAGEKLGNRTFYSAFLHSLPRHLEAFVALYDSPPMMSTPSAQSSS